jgi:hypothetical protein
MRTHFTSVVGLLMLSSIFMAFASQKTNSNHLAQNYITQFAEIAQLESLKNGVPVSIILGQGILESAAGTSKLAREGNNHFGIKWANGMPYGSMKMKDDDFDHIGNLIASRFCTYDSAQESFEHHSKHLKKNPRYASLFEYDRDDYKSWAYGLKRCGYATAPDYAEKLIRTIELNGLAQYDIPLVLAFEDETDFHAQADTETEEINLTVVENKPTQQYTLASDETDLVLFDIDTPQGVTQTKKVPAAQQVRAKVTHDSEPALFDIIPQKATAVQKKK